MQSIEFVSPSLSYKRSNATIDVLPFDPRKKPQVRWFVGEKLLYSTEHTNMFKELHYKSCRTSCYTHEDDTLQGSFSLSCPEHLAPVFLLWPQTSFDVRLDADTPEVPLMDGSALTFFCKLRNYCGAPQDLTFYDAPIFMDYDLKNETAETYGHVRVVPAETFEVEYVLDRKFRECKLESAASFSIYSAESLYQIFAARTFIHQAELDALRRQGLLAGVDLSSGLLINESEISPVSRHFRIANELAVHKILDLIGDLTFVCPALPKVRIEITNGGHDSHRQIMEKLISCLC
ncbi:MAG: UDP-3-O-acyl-N-acetylglucosamine deacetylase [Fibrobacter sp.]|nr:UDP-3-O-acyl-N-acetylglucosamine deacetylase [Fibrobacter sp.]